MVSEKTPARITLDSPSILKISGHLDFDGSAGLFAQGKELVTAGRGDLEIDLSGIEWANSVCLALLFHLLRVAKAANRKVAITGIPEDVSHLAEVVGVASFLPTPDARAGTEDEPSSDAGSLTGDAQASP